MSATRNNIHQRLDDMELVLTWILANNSSEVTLSPLVENRARQAANRMIERAAERAGNGSLSQKPETPDLQVVKSGEKSS